MRSLALGALAASSLSGVFWAVQTSGREKTLGAFSTSLEGRSRNQRHNALLAAHRLNGAQIPAGGTFSFNGRVGSFNRDEGYRRAPVSYNGQLIDSWGGGVCQTSTALYNAALLGGLGILERHPHQFQPSYVPPGRDAAVAFGECDLRLRNPYPSAVRIQASAQGDRLLVRLVSEAASPAVSLREDVESSQKPGTLYLGAPSDRGKLRNSGKAGYRVSVYRRVGEREELVSRDTYPAMMRVVQYR